MTRRLGSLAILAFVGLFLGALIGSLATGDPVYFVIWPIALTLVFLVAGVLGSAARRGTLSGRVPGIRNPGDPEPPPRVSVLNPESTAIPATGATLNGEPVDIRTPDTAVPTSVSRRPGAGLSRAIGIAVILGVAALTLIPSYRLIGWTVGGVVQGRWDAADPRTGIYQQEMVDDLAAAAGSWDLVTVSFYEGYVLAQFRTTPSASTTDNFEWRYGRASRLGPASGSLDGMFDGSLVDFDIVGRVVAAAKADAGWPQFTSVYPSVRLGTEGEPEITVSLGSDYYQASYTYSIEGELIDRQGTGLD